MFYCAISKLVIARNLKKRKTEEQIIIYNNLGGQDGCSGVGGRSVFRNKIRPAFIQHCKGNKILAI
jgi:hypothetical protein